MLFSPIQRGVRQRAASTFDEWVQIWDADPHIDDLVRIDYPPPGTDFCSSLERCNFFGTASILFIFDVLKRHGSLLFTFRTFCAITADGSRLWDSNRLTKIEKSKNQKNIEKSKNRKFSIFRCFSIFRFFGFSRGASFEVLYRFNSEYRDNVNCSQLWDSNHSRKNYWIVNCPPSSNVSLCMISNNCRSGTMSQNVVSPSHVCVIYFNYFTTLF